MATPKSNPKTPKPAPQPRDAEPAPGPDQLLTLLPALTDTHRAAFEAQRSDADCAALGAKTKSSAVRSCALAWAADAAPAVLNTALATEIDYAPVRLAWLVELLVRLDAARDAAGRSNVAQSTVRTVRDVSRKKAVSLRKRLLSKLTRVVMGDDLAAAALSDAGAAPTDAAIAGSLETLASIVDNATKSKDSAARALADAARLTAADATAARAAAAAIKSAKEDVALGGRAHGDRDTPAVNLVEGRILVELLFLRDAFDDARRRGVPVPPLVPHSGVRQVLAHSHPKKGEPTVDAGTPPPAAPQ